MVNDPTCVSTEENFEHLNSEALAPSVLLFQMNSLELRVQKLQDELFAAQDEAASLQQKYEQVCDCFSQHLSHLCTVN